MTDDEATIARLHARNLVLYAQLLKAEKYARSLEAELSEYKRQERQLWAQGLAATEPIRLDIVNLN